MPGRRTTALLAAALVAALTQVPASARASGPDAPIDGDVTGDGVPDRTNLGGGDPHGCEVLVEAGRAAGGYLPARKYLYPQPGGPRGYCPDTGAATDLTGDGVAELVVTWYAGRPAGTGNDLLVLTGVADDRLGLTGYRVTGGIPALGRPNHLGTADFNGDGRQDVFGWSDQGDGFASYLNTGAGTLVPGPVRYRCGALQYKLADFDGDDASDVALSYRGGSGRFATGVVVLLDSGATRDLRGSVEPGPGWMVSVQDADENGTSDVLTYDRATGGIVTFLGAGNGNFAASPWALDDAVTVLGGQPSVIEVLANDHATKRATVTVVTPPRYGVAEVAPDRTIVYTRSAAVPPTGIADILVYRVVQDGRGVTAIVHLRLVL